MGVIPHTTFAMYGFALGLDEPRVIEALLRALRTAGPGRGGRFVGPHHVVGDDETSLAAVDALRELAASRSTVSASPA